VIFLPNIIIGVITMAAGIAHYIAEDLLGNSGAGIAIYIIYKAEQQSTTSIGASALHGCG
jgi:hypothetical protein